MTEWSVRTDNILMMEIRSWQNRKTWGNRFLSSREVWEEGLSRGSRTFTVVSTNKNINKGKCCMQSYRQQLRHATKLSVNTRHVHIFFFFKNQTSCPFKRHQSSSSEKLISNPTQQVVWDNSPVDFRTPGKDKLSHSPSGGFSPADTSPFCLLRTCNTAACLTSTRTSAPSSCVQGDPAFRWLKLIKHVCYSWKRKTLFALSKTLFLYLTYTRMIVHEILQK